jgi:hypothetical protein
MNGRCNHERGALPLVSRTDWVLSPSDEIRPQMTWSPAAERAPSVRRTGHTRLDPQPPRTRS